MSAWYSTKILFKSEVIGENPPPHCYEESIRVFLAVDDAEAEDKAREIGEGNEHKYRNENGEEVNWRFVKVIEVQSLCENEITDGMEVFSTLSRQC